MMLIPKKDTRPVNFHEQVHRSVESNVIHKVYNTKHEAFWGQPKLFRDSYGDSTLNTKITYPSALPLSYRDSL